MDCSVALFADDPLLCQEVTTTQGIRLFQHNLTSLGAWAMRWGIDFNVNKRKIITFNNSDKVYPPRYKLNEKDLEQVTDSQYLGVTLQENLRFSKHIEAKITNTMTIAKKQLGMIKRALFWAPQRAKLLA